MQGYILHTQKVKDEDLLVFILTKEYLVKSYRFYGARHPNIMLGHKIDFELVENIKFLPHLRNVIHLGFIWQLNRERLLIWQQFMRLVFTHLKDVDEVESVYFAQLENCAQKFEKQNPKRLIIESYVRILEHEGRLHSELECFVCDERISGKICLVRGFLPAHDSCLNQAGFSHEKIEKLFNTKSTAWLDDIDVERLYQILLEGF
ncbi:MULTISPECIES: recombination protein RecO [unclassified Campylobacter]|uniref:recombination protein RecO n=1 Tax=unclassified Campylobacter TaxID=2593542 RepID=UPI003D341006